MPIPSNISVATIATTSAVLTKSMMTGRTTCGFDIACLGNHKHMSGADKAKNKIEDLGGRAKEAIGKATGDDDTRNEGRADRAKSSLKDAGEKVKDALKR
jgi:uncharacterized protein YjbJ (UPF0337 family)